MGIERLHALEMTMLAMMLLAMTVSCGVAVLSYTFFEEPILRLKRFFASAAGHGREAPLEVTG
jgi:peptidoglycan/LPS O-acetylase OafA/YrhL